MKKIAWFFGHDNFAVGLFYTMAIVMIILIKMIIDQQAEIANIEYERTKIELSK